MFSSRVKIDESRAERMPLSQGSLDYLSGGNTPNNSEIRYKVSKIKRMVTKLYDRLAVSNPIVEIVICITYMSNIWAILNPIHLPIKEIKE